MAPINSAARRTASSAEAVFVITLSNMTCNCFETLKYSGVEGRARAALNRREVWDDKGKTWEVNIPRLRVLGESTYVVRPNPALKFLSTANLRMFITS